MSTIPHFGEAAEACPAPIGRNPDRAELALAFEQHRDKLIRLISLRLDRRLSGRVDPSDIVQEAFVRASAAFDEYCHQSSLPLYNWLRIQTQFAVGDCHRTHLATQKRAAGQEHRDASDASVRALEELAESMISPASQVARAELAGRVREIISSMAANDREILLLRHIEELSISEAAAELNISVDTAKKRHLRAIRRLQELCSRLNESIVSLCP